ncbi:hypothetical protein [Pedobacter sp. UYP1]|uniref:hypothetical protein n=1 Tax=Pedobacter sp. UYP1 TaxID=1756396 RepID=UPI003396F33C
MRTSLNKVKVIDDYISGYIAPEEAHLFEANMLLNKDLANHVLRQQSAYAMIREYSRQKIKDEIMTVQKTLATAPPGLYAAHSQLV